MVQGIVVIRPKAADIRAKLLTKRVDIVPKKEIASSPPDLAAITVVDRRRPTKYADDHKERTNLSMTDILRQWNKRFSLFHKFHDGVMINEKGFDTICPEVLATHISTRCGYETIIDPFCGAGGNAIQLALNGSKVIAIDIDEEMILLARKNARVYGVEDKIDFRVGDCFEIAPGLQAEAIVTSPPWEGSERAQKSRFDAEDLGSRKAGGMAAILRLSRMISKRVVLHVPKTTDIDQSLILARDAGFGYVEFEHVHIDGQFMAINIYLRQRVDSTHKMPAVVKNTIFLKTPSILERVKSNQQYSGSSFITQYKDYMKTVDNYIRHNLDDHFPYF